MFPYKYVEYYSVEAYDCDNRCVGIAEFYTNEEAANEHQKWLLEHNEDLYDIRVIFHSIRAKTRFEPREDE